MSEHPLTDEADDATMRYSNRHERVRSLAQLLEVKFNQQSKLIDTMAPLMLRMAVIIAETPIEHLSISKEQRLEIVNELNNLRKHLT